MASQTAPEADPLVSALPPATDYMTYLTLLEYQLTPQNLPTLSRLLNEDDGTLATEIGWDLLKLVLRFLNDTPDEANRCLEIIARRGNPREVVVRVAEELEKLGDDADDVDENASSNGDDGDDELPTFAGEAPRVHLGAMTLDGMPEVKPKAAEASPAEPQQPDEQTALTAASKDLKLQSLLNMLGILHPRIRTQYPSRFLATSLPAALGAYRHVPITTSTTLSFLAVLEKLAGKSRPPLPPRVSTTQVPTGASGTNQDAPTSTAPLPDPEAKAEEAETGVNIPSQDEKTIIFRLLHAVLLEILDEYLSSFSSGQVPSMSWTARLREGLEPKRLLPDRTTETQQFTTTPELKDREAVMAKIKKLSLDLGFDVSAEVRKLVHTGDETENVEDETEQELSEYPTSPSQIPLPRAGVIFLYAYDSYVDTTDARILLPTAAIAQLIDHSSPLSATPSIPSAALLDSLLSLLYRQALATSDTKPTANTEFPQLSPAKFLLLLSTLTQLFTITPWAGLRDSAHHIATKLLHNYPKPEVRIQAIAQTIEGSTLSTNWAEFEEEPAVEPGIDEETGLTRSTSALQPHPIPLAPPQQLGVLKAVGVDWLKDEFLVSIRDPSQQTSLGSNTDVLGSGEPSAENNTTKSLLDLLFPADLPILHADNAGTDDTLSDFLLDIPFHISTLNLLSVILPRLQAQDAKAVLERAYKHVELLGSSLKFLTLLFEHAGKGDGADADADETILAESRADINALQDAYLRVSAILEGKATTV